MSTTFTARHMTAHVICGPYGYPALGPKVENATEGNKHFGTPLHLINGVLSFSMLGVECSIQLVHTDGIESLQTLYLVKCIPDTNRFKVNASPENQDGKEVAQCCQAGAGPLVFYKTKIQTGIDKMLYNHSRSKQESHDLKLDQSDPAKRKENFSLNCT